MQYGKHFTPEAGVIQEEIKEDSAHSHATQDGHQKPQEEFDTPESIQEKPDDLKTQISVTPSSESEKDDKDDPSDSDLSFLDRDSTSSKETVCPSKFFNCPVSQDTPKPFLSSPGSGLIYRGFSRELKALMPCGKSL